MNENFGGPWLGGGMVTSQGDTCIRHGKEIQSSHFNIIPFKYQRSIALL